MRPRTQFGWTFIYLLVLTGTTGVLLWILFRDTNGLSLPALALAGVIALLASLLLFTTLLNLAGLSDATQALGLPDGSVRAIIALALVGLFAILAASVLQAEPTIRHEFAGLEDSTINALILAHPDMMAIKIPEGGTPPHFKLVLLSNKNQVSEFGKQMLTLVGTLMTAITAFYFGGRTSAFGGNDVSRAAPELTGLLNATRAPTKDTFTLTLTGSNLNSIRTVRLVRDKDELEAVSVWCNPTQVSCIFPSNPEFEIPGAWDVVVVDDIGRTATKKAGLTFKDAATGTQQPPPAKPPSARLDTQAITAGQETPVIITGSGLGAVTKIEATKGEGSNPLTVEAAEKSDIQIKVKLTLETGTWTLALIMTDSSKIPVEGEIKVS